MTFSLPGVRTAPGHAPVAEWQTRQVQTLLSIRTCKSESCREYLLGSQDNLPRFDMVVYDIEIAAGPWSIDVVMLSTIV